MITIGFTGHRPSSLYGYQKSQNGRYQRLMLRLVEHIHSLINDYADEHDTFRIVTGGAQGGDMLFFAAANRVKKELEEAGSSITIINEIAVPFEGQEIRWQPDGIFGSDTYMRMIDKADTVTMITEDEPQSARAAVAALHQRNDYIIDQSDVLVALTAHETAFHALTTGETSNSGTISTALKASAAEKRVIIIDPFVTK